MVLGIGAAPMLTAFLKSDRNVGTLVIVTGEDGVNVFLNGKPYRRQTQRGQVRIPNLDVKDYTVRVAKDGFMDTPEQHASLRKGEEFKVEFQLKPMPKVASLAIQGAIPGSQVLLDQNPIGTVQDDGNFTASSVPPGEHTIELRKDAYKPRKIEKRFEASQTVQLAAADVALEKLPGTLKLNLAPADAQVTIARQGEDSAAGHRRHSQFARRHLHSVGPRGELSGEDLHRLPGPWRQQDSRHRSAITGQIGS